MNATALRSLALLPGIFLGLLPCVPAVSPALASGTAADHLVHIQICTTPGQVKYLVLNLITGEMSEQTVEHEGPNQPHQKCGHSMCQDAPWFVASAPYGEALSRLDKISHSLSVAILQADYRSHTARGPPDQA